MAEEAMPWEARDLYHSQPEKNKAISVERLGKLRELIKNDYEGFWAEVANDIEWFKPWEQTLKGGLPHTPEVKFFAGGKANVCYNMLDRHLQKGAANRLALIWENEAGDRAEFYTYQMMYNEVCRFSNALKSLGLQKGDRMALFMPNSPAVAIAIMAAYRLGLAFTPLFTGLSVNALRARLNNFEPQVLVTLDGTYRKGKVLSLKAIIDETLQEVKSVQTVVLSRNTGNSVAMLEGRDRWWDELTGGMAADCSPVEVEANEIGNVLYTSGTMGKPKGAAVAGVGIAVQTCLGGKIESGMCPSDVYYSLNDNAWAGSEDHAILPVWLNGGTMVWQEGAAFGLPSLHRFYSTIEKYGVNKVHLAPTVLRMLKAADEELLAGHDLSGLELILCMGEPVSLELWRWVVQVLGKGKLYLNNVGDQTELGGCIIQPTAFIDPMKPGAMGRTDSLLGGPAVGVVNDSGVNVPCNTRGNMVFKLPVPGAARTLWGEHDRYLRDYFREFDGKYCWFVQDEGVIDEDGYFWVLGRLDDVINVAGHRMTTSEIENVISKVGEVESAAVIGIPDPIKEQVPVAFVKLREGAAGSKEMSDRINGEVVEKIGRIASLGEIIFVKQLPTTISGKIMRRVLRDLRVHGKITGDITTLEDTGSISLLKNAMGFTDEK